nr:CPBP family glutamic-type intramembrane protease [Secundilactobacillus collinoides]
MTIITNLITVGLLGYLFGWLFIKSRSLWPGIIVHSVWDLLVVALIGG